MIKHKLKIFIKAASIRRFQPLRRFRHMYKPIVQVEFSKNTDIGKVICEDGKHILLRYVMQDMIDYVSYGFWEEIF